MRADDIPAIRELALFRDMEEENFQNLVKAAYVQTFPPQVDLTTAGDHSDFLHIVFSGSVELYANWNGRETSMATVRPISTFILAATIKDAPYLMSARTAEKSRIIMLPSPNVRAVFEQDNGFARAVVTELAQCYRSVVKTSKNLKLRTSIERVANYFLRCHRRVDGASEFKLQMEKRRLASFLGMTPENLSRAIKALRAYGVEVDGEDVKITNLSELERFAKPDPLIDNYST
ncbi:cyclic nucleotide-binding domain-containing protein [Roseovarius sp. A21]|uniref:Cyclic nucleotide-binding domain-containing protein n=1 Tax=Roseovarius bejariae TaxID=2576383 RepID=A0A844CJ40_9RHOB|nr:cyclic nucleotide-binding domain-containing protein [Roseovarius bejariae]